MVCVSSFRFSQKQTLRHKFKCKGYIRVRNWELKWGGKEAKKVHYQASCHCEQLKLTLLGTLGPGQSVSLSAILHKG